MSTSQRAEARVLRKGRVRKKIVARGFLRPRLSVFRSGKHIYAQIIDDNGHKTLAAASTISKEIKKDVKKAASVDAAKQVGQLIAKKALAAKIKDVCFDRNGYLYHGRIKALADAARAEGLNF